MNFPQLVDNTKSCYRNPLHHLITLLVQWRMQTNTTRENKTSKYSIGSPNQLLHAILLRSVFCPMRRRLLLCSTCSTSTWHTATNTSSNPVQIWLRHSHLYVISTVPLFVKAYNLIHFRYRNDHVHLATCMKGASDVSSLETEHPSHIATFQKYLSAKTTNTENVTTPHNNKHKQLWATSFLSNVIYTHRKYQKASSTIKLLI